jgi:ATP synthase protein I
VDNDSTRFTLEVSRKANRKLRAQRTGAQPVWFGLGMFGVIGWSVAAPTLLGAMLGAWHDKHHPGPHSWTLALLVAGLILGCANAWYWMSAQTAAIRKGSIDDE